jgi:nucleoside-diphosphate-sugar epimerase
MLEQYGLQYDFDYCCLRAPWIMEKDDFRYQLSFGEDVFGGPRWRDLVGASQADAYVEQRAVPVMLDEPGRSVKRNFVHVEDLVDAILAALDQPAARRQTFNICMDEPVDYGQLGAYLAESRGLPTVEIRTPYHSTWLDTRKRSSCSTGAHATTSSGWWKKHGATSATPKNHASSGIRDSPATSGQPARPRGPITDVPGEPPARPTPRLSPATRTPAA